MIKQIITTPLFYVNAQPHIGHLYSMIYADAIAKYKQINLLTGTDEHGIKVYKSANNQPIQQYCDQVSNKFQKLADKFIHYDQFIRTTDTKHKQQVQYYWNLLNQNGQIIKDTYKGYYCQIEESFVNHKTEQYVEENNYFFKIDQNYVEECINKAPLKFQSELRQQTFKDFCISRPKNRQQWGIEVPNDNNSMVYVWFDALLGYLQNEQQCHYMHVIGKDIVKFHAIFWPSFLRGLNNNSTTELIVHNHWIRNNMKMSKSLQNVVDPFQLSEKYTKDQIRLYFLSQGPQNCDISFEENKLEKCWNQYIDQFNNLLYRLIRPKIMQKNLQLQQHLFDDQLIQAKNEFIILQNSVKELLNKNLFVEAYLELQRIFNHLNMMVDKNQPWKEKDIIRKEQFLSLMCILISITQSLLKVYIETNQIITPEFKEFPINNTIQINVNLDLDLRLKRFN